MSVQPYLFFDGRCEEALEFYKKALGAEIGMLMRFGESPDPAQVPPGSQNKVMHASFTVRGNQLMASDGHCAGKPSFQGFGLSLAAASPAEAEKLFGALGEGGQVLQPLTKTFFAASFGMVADRFGVMWMVMAER
ncbi:MAG: VOC family protein [Reyranellaceae bacterium]